MSSFFGGGEQQDVKLSEQEQKMVAKLLSDPTYFPLEFRTWLKNYIEGAGISVTASQIVGSTGQRTGLPAGIIIPLGGAAAKPPDTVPCDGIAYSRTTYEALFKGIGTAWGGGDGSTTFNVPDFRDRTLFGAGAHIGVAATEGHAFGSSQRHGPWHGHSVNQSPHGHGIDAAPSGHYHDLGTVWDNYAEPGGKLATDAATSSGPIGGSGPNVTPQNANVTVGPANMIWDSFAHAGVLYVITTGKTA